MPRSRSRRRALVRGSALDFFEHRRPSAQTALDIFRGEWWSRFPDSSGESGGEFRSFEDARVAWGLERLPVKGARVLELGPLEGGHTYMLERAGAASVVGVEGNRRAYLKCLITKEVLGLDRSTFLCGDAIEYLRDAEEEFDVCIASGILYHLVDPVGLLALLARRATCLFLWTHYYDPDLISARYRMRFGSPRAGVSEGFAHQLHSRRYGFLGRRLVRFPGGSRPKANWLARPDLLAALEHFGWTRIEIAFDEPDTPRGPSLALVAFQDEREAAERIAG
jgi:Protein of unknown function (DUF1698)